MNVNREKRIRRTPEEAKELILATAADRFSEMGLEGLNISGVASQAGISHATVIHHFGSTEAMRQALLAQMTESLLKDILTALREDVPNDEVVTRLFKALSKNRHGSLVAWLALDKQIAPDKLAESTVSLFAEILTAIGARPEEGQTETRLQVLLVACAALGFSIAGDALSALAGLNEGEIESFPAWIAERLEDR